MLGESGHDLVDEYELKLGSDAITMGTDGKVFDKSPLACLIMSAQECGTRVYHGSRWHDILLI